MQALIQKREQVAEPASQMKKRKKLNIQSGKSICVDIFDQITALRLHKESNETAPKKEGLLKKILT